MAAPLLNSGRSNPFRPLLPLAVLAVLFCLFHREVLFEGNVYLNSWIFRNHAPFPPAGSAVLNPLNTGSDFVTHNLANRYVVADAYRKGALPLWNTRNFCGFPIYANGSSAAFSPFSLLFFVLDPLRSYTIQLLIVFAMGGVFTWIYFRRYLEFSPTASAAGVAVLIFSPHLAEHVDYQALLGFVWAFPLTLIAFEWGRNRRFLAGDLAAGTVIAFTALSSHTHVAVNACTLYALYRLFAGPGGWGRRFAGVLAAFAVLGVFMFWLLWPTALFFIDSQWVPMGGVKAGVEWHMPLALPFINAVYPAATHLVLPVRGLERLFRFPLAETPVVGFAVFVLALAGAGAILSKDRRPALMAPAIMWGGTFLAQIVTFPGILGSLLNVAAIKWWQIHIFASAVLAAFAVDAMAQNDAVRRWVRGALAFFGLLFVLPVTLGAAAITFFPETVRARVFELARGRFADASGSLDPARFSEPFRHFAEAFSLGSPFVLLPLIVLGGLFFGTSKGGKYRKAVVLAVILIELIVLGLRFKPVPVRPETAFSETKAIHFLKSDPGLFRIMSIQTPARKGEGVQKYILKPKLGAVWGLDDVGGQESVLHGRYLYFAQKYLGGRPDAPFRNTGILDFEDLNLRAASFLNVKYVLVDDRRKFGGGGLEPVLTADGLTIYRNANALERVFFTRRVKPWENCEKAFRSMTEGKAGEEPAIFVEENSQALEPGPEAPASVRILSYRRGDIETEVRTPDRGVLVYTDIAAPGWKALVDGKETPIVKVNGLFKGVFLASGTHSVRFEYHIPLPDL